MSVLFLFVNWILVSCLITPAAVTYWRGTWQILDLFSSLAFTNGQVGSAWMTFAASFGMIYLHVLLVEDYLKALSNQKIARKVLCLVIFYPLSFMIVTFWRGLWLLLDYYTTTSFASFCASHVVGFLIVLSAKTTSSIVSLPGYCINERFTDPSDSGTLEGKIEFIKTSTLNDWADSTARMFNSFITVFIIGGAVVSYWRGTWGIVKRIKDPNDKVISSVLVMSVGYAISSVCYCFSEFIATKKLNPPFSLWYRAVEQGFVYILGFGMVSTWVGIWHLEDIYLLPDQPVVSALFCHFIGIALLYLLQGSLNLIGSPAGCRIHPDQALEGLDMGSYLKRETEKDHVQPSKSSAKYHKASVIESIKNKELEATQR